MTTNLLLKQPEANPFRNHAWFFSSSACTDFVFVGSPADLPAKPPNLAFSLDFLHMTNPGRIE